MQQCSLGISETLRQGGRCAAGRSQGSGTAARRSPALPSALPAELRAWHGFALGPGQHLHQHLFGSSAKAQPRSISPPRGGNSSSPALLCPREAPLQWTCPPSSPTASERRPKPALSPER